MGYKLFTYPLVDPKFVEANGPTGKRQILNPGPFVALPSNIVYQPENFDKYAVVPAARTLLYQVDGAGDTNDQVFAACPDLRDWKAKQVRAEGDRRLEKMATPYMKNERLTWQDQKFEALEYQANPAAFTPMIDAMAANRGIAKADLVKLILENVNLFRPTAGTILGQQQAMLDRIYAVTDVAELLSITWE